MTVERKRLLSRWNDVHRATQAVEPEQRPDPTPFDRELLAIATIDQGDVVDIDQRFFESFEDSLPANRNPALRSVDQVTVT